jgi:glycosyltransferase involved in cell wall biosynthesis
MLVESLALGTPVISVNCESGPSEIIIDKHNGLLVENNNPDVFAEAMNRFISDQELYTHCKNNAKESVQKFSMENISKDWKRIIESVI